MEYIAVEPRVRKLARCNHSNFKTTIRIVKLPKGSNVFRLTYCDNCASQIRKEME